MHEQVRGTEGLYSAHVLGNASLPGLVVDTNYLSVVATGVQTSIQAPDQSCQLLFSTLGNS